MEKYGGLTFRIEFESDGEIVACENTDLAARVHVRAEYLKRFKFHCSVFGSKMMEIFQNRYPHDCALPVLKWFMKISIDLSNFGSFCKKKKVNDDIVSTDFRKFRTIDEKKKRCKAVVLMFRVCF